MPPEPSPEAWAQIRYDYEHTGTPIEDICAAHGISSGTLRDRMRRWRWTRRRPPISRQGPPPMPRIDIVAPAPAAEPASAAATAALHGHSGARAKLASPESITPKCDYGFRLSPPDGGSAGMTANDAAPPVETAAPLLAAAPAEAAPLEPTAPQANVDAPGAPEDIVPRLQSAVARVLPAIETVVLRLGAGPMQPREMEQAARALASLTRTLRELNGLLDQRQSAPGGRICECDDMPEDIDAFRNELARRIHLFVESRRGETESGAEPQGL